MGIVLKLRTWARRAAGTAIRVEENNAVTDKNLYLRRRAIGTLLVVVTSPVWLAQRKAPGQEATAQKSSAFSPSKAVGLFAYPKKDQSSDEQLKDESACYSSAHEKTGVDPQAPPPAAKSADQKAAEQKAAADSAPKAKGGRARGAARGAAGGAAIGAIADDEAGKGAGAGAVAGTMRGGAKQRQANAANKQQAAQQTAQAQQHEEAQTKAQYQEKINTFKRAYTACMEAREYSVKWHNVEMGFRQLIRAPVVVCRIHAHSPLATG